MKNFSTATSWFALLLLPTSCLVQAAAVAKCTLLTDASVCYQVTSDDTLRLASAVEVDGGKPSPRIRYATPSPTTAIPSQQILPFLAQSLPVAATEFNQAAQIVAAQDGRAVLGTGDRIYVRGDLGSNGMFQIFRPAQALIDPVSKEVLAHEAAYIGIARLQEAERANEDVHVLTIVEARQEIGIGDRLLPMARGVEQIAADYVPHAPATAIDARIMSVQDGVDQVGQHQIVILNKGAADNIDQGTVLNVYQKASGNGQHAGVAADMRLPDRKTATMLIFRVSARVAYGLIMTATEPVRIGDRVGGPG